MATRSFRWAFIYIGLPATPAIIEFLAKMLLTGFRCSPWNALPCVTIVILVVAVSMMIREELGRYTVPDADEVENEEMRIARDGLIWFSGIGLVLVALLSGFEQTQGLELIHLGSLTRDDIRRQTDLAVQFSASLLFTKYAALFYALLFIFMAKSMQQRYKLGFAL